MKRQPCAACGRPTVGVRCPACEAPVRARREAQQRQRGYSRAHWQRVRALVLARDGYRCRLQREGCRGLANTVHLDPALGGLHDLAQPEDCVAACRHCHGVVDAPRASSSTRRRE